MNIEDFRDYCISKPGVTEEFPFDNKTLVFKVMGKMFALCDVDEFHSFNLKCNPERAIELREQFDGIKPGYHMNKVHWNTVTSISDVPHQLALELIDHSYELVVKGLKKIDREKLKIDHAS